MKGALVDDSDLAALAEGQSAGAEFSKVGSASYRWRPYAHVTSTGLTGNPARASAAKGEALLEVGAAKTAALICDPATWAAASDTRQGSIGGVAFRAGS